MTLILELSPDLEAKLKFTATSRGVTPEKLAIDVLSAIPDLTQSGIVQGSAEWVELLMSGGVHGPFLSDESLRRENIYEDYCHFR